MSGTQTAAAWVRQGHRTLDDLHSVESTLTRCQRIGLKYYDELLDRMPRSEAAQIEATVISTHSYLFYSVFTKKNTHSRFLLYLPGKCSDLNNIFRECLRRNKYSVDVRLKYSLLLATLFWRHIYTFVNNGFYRWRWEMNCMHENWQWTLRVLRVIGK